MIHQQKDLLFSFQYDDDQGSRYDKSVFEFYILSLLCKAKTIFPDYVYKFDFDICIDGYEFWKEEKRLQFEYWLQNRFNATKLNINGQSLEIPFWKRWLGKRIELIRLLLPLAIIYCGLVLINLSVLNILLTISLAILAEHVGFWVWSVFVGKLLPHSYIDYIKTDSLLKGFIKASKKLFKKFFS